MGLRLFALLSSLPAAAWRDVPERLNSFEGSVVKLK